MFKIWMHLIYMKDLNCHHLYWEKQMPSWLQSHIFLIFNQFEDMPQISNIKDYLICWLGLQNKLYFLFLFSPKERTLWSVITFFTLWIDECILVVVQP